MSITSITETWEEMQLVQSLESGFTAVRNFEVLCNTGTESPVTILLGSTVGPVELPQIGSLFPGSGLIRCTERTPTRTADSRELWYVNCQYKSFLNSGELQRMADQNPLNRPATIEWIERGCMKPYRRLKLSGFYQNYSAAVESTFKMRSAANSAGDPFEPILEFASTDWVAVVKKNVGSIPAWFTTYQNAVNNAPFQLNFYGTPITIEKGCGKLFGISMPLPKQENGVQFMELGFQIGIRAHRDKRTPGESLAPEPWDEEILDMGMRIIAQSIAVTGPSVGKSVWTNIKSYNEEETSITLPVPFNGSGYPVIPPVGAIAGAIDEDQMWYRLAAPNKRKDFSVLPLT